MTSTYKYFLAGCTDSKRKRSYQDKLSQWACGKIALTNLQREAFLKEQDLKLNLIDSKEKAIKAELLNEIKTRVELNKQEHVMRMKHMQGKHEKEMEILELQKKALQQQIASN